jgi:hypothetical protein
MAAPFCTPRQVAEAAGEDPFEGAELEMAARQCRAVSAMIRSRRPLIDTWIADGDLDAELVLEVACQVVSRVLTTLKTGGVGIRSEQHPEYSYELTASAAAGLNLTKAELVLLTPTAGRPRPFSIHPA